MRTAARVDANQKQVVLNLRQLGCKVLILSMVGKGCPDLLIGYNGRLTLVELKDGDKPPSKQKLTEDEEVFFEEWEGLPIYKCNSVQEIMDKIGMRGYIT